MSLFPNGLIQDGLQFAFETSYKLADINPCHSDYILPAITSFPNAPLATHNRMSPYFFERGDRSFGTLPPALRASESPIAMACLRLFTFFPPFPPLSSPPFI